jgi:hypothetical protein
VKTLVDEWLWFITKTLREMHLKAYKPKLSLFENEGIFFFFFLEILPLILTKFVLHKPLNRLEKVAPKA